MIVRMLIALLIVVLSFILGAVWCMRATKESMGLVTFWLSFFANSSPEHIVKVKTAMLAAEYIRDEKSSDFSS